MSNIEEIKKILSRIVKESLGMVNAITFTWRDGIPIAFIAPNQADAEFMSVAVAVAVGSLDALGDAIGSKVRRIDVELENGEHVLISVLDGSLLALNTIPRPNLGLIHIILRKYEKSIKEKGGVGEIGSPELSKSSG